jgi:hypothetical protein
VNFSIRVSRGLQRLGYGSPNRPIERLEVSAPERNGSGDAFASPAQHARGSADNGDATRPEYRLSLALVVPTRNEAWHIEPFVERVKAALEPFPFDWHAEMIDDSQDDTARVLHRLAGQGAPLKVFDQQESGCGPGLGGAIRTGLGRANGDIVCVIDADLQHPPEVLPELLAPIALGRADICVGSRYRRGGSAAGLETHWRRLAARGSGIAARWLLPATRLTSDPGSGLFAMRREILDGVPLRSRGSRVLAEILVRARWHTICDVPYRFAHTDAVPSELGIRDAVAVGRELFTLRLRKARLDALRESRGSSRGGPLRTRRRVAPVHVELLRDLGSGRGALPRTDASGELR